MSAKGTIERRARRKLRIRRRVSGTAERPRLSVFRSARHIYVQAIDDISGRTLAQASSLHDEVVSGLVGDGARSSVSVAVGKAIAQRLKEQNIESAVFDRSGYLYHGRVQAVADGAREAGLKV
jgi:large subunit ribosomal protein L18